MLIALIADIHANLPALNAVLEHCKGQGVNEIWNAGDSIGYGPYPVQVIQRLMEEEITSILGNYDRKVLLLPKKVEQWKNKKNPLKLETFQWAANQLSSETRQYLSTLPETWHTERLSREILLVHGSPASRSEHLTTTTKPERFAALAALTDAQIIIFGHSHQPFVRHIHQAMFINPGSVGRQDDGDYRASYAVLELTKQRAMIHHHRIDYDLNLLIQQLQASCLPAPIIEMFRRGISLDAVLDG